MDHKMPEPLDIITPAANGRWCVAGVLNVGSFREALDLVLDNVSPPEKLTGRWVVTADDRTLKTRIRWLA